MNRNSQNGIGTSRNFKSRIARFHAARRRSIARVMLVLLPLLMLLPSQTSIVPNRVLAAKGDLVPGFGTNGFAITDFSGKNDSAYDIAADLKGRILAVGFATTTTGADFALARYMGDGRLDQTFGDGGKVTTDFFGSTDSGYGVGIQPDGKMVVSGSATNGTNTLYALARYLDDGQLDPAFGTGGKVTLDVGLTEQGFKLALQEDGKIVVAGYSGPANNTDLTLVRFDSNGGLDTLFGNGGIVKVDFSGRNDGAVDLVVRDDKITAVGSATNGQTSLDFAMFQCNLDGTPDTSFGNAGKVTTDFSGKVDFAQSIAIDNKRLLVGGAATNGTPDFGIAAYNNDGSLDSSFGTGGKATLDFFNGIDLIYEVIAQPDGDILGIGRADGATGVGTGVARAGGATGVDTGVAQWNLGGGLVTTFGQGGKVIVDTLGTDNAAFGGMIYLNTVITAGVAGNSTTGDNLVLTQNEIKQFVEFTKEASPNPSAEGDIITYTFTIKNLTDREVKARIRDFLPNNEFITINLSSDDPNWFYFRSVATHRTFLVGSGETREIKLRCTVHMEYIRGFTLINHAGLVEDVSLSLLAEAEVSSEVTPRTALKLTRATKSGKHVDLEGEGFAPGAQILVNGEPVKTIPGEVNPTTSLLYKKGFKQLVPGQTVVFQVRNPNGEVSNDIRFTKPE